MKLSTIIICLLIIGCCWFYLYCDAMGDALGYWYMVTNSDTARIIGGLVK